MGKPLDVLFIDESRSDAEQAIDRLRSGGYDPSFAIVDSPEGLKTALSRRQWDLAISECVGGGLSAAAALALITESGRDLPLIVLSDGAGDEAAVTAIRLGARDYITKDRLTYLLPAVERELRLSQEHLARKQAEKELTKSIERLRRSMEGAVQAMALTVEIRDPYTAGHQHRVAQLAHAIAKEMELPEEQVDGIRLAAAIHDIGKIYIPAEILSKPGRINENEFSMIRTHPQVGYDILKTIEFPWPIATIVLQHHQRIDGSGYPLNMPGEGILLEARILSVADVVEAMSSHRPYRPALGVDRALREIAQNSGLLYEPGVVTVCMRLFMEKGFVFE